MNNTVITNTGVVAGYRCSQCGDVKEKMWGNTCNSCRDVNAKHAELLAEIKDLKDRLVKIQGGNK